MLFPPGSGDGDHRRGAAVLRACPRRARPAICLVGRGERLCPPHFGDGEAGAGWGAVQFSRAVRAGPRPPATVDACSFHAAPCVLGHLTFGALEMPGLPGGIDPQTAGRERPSLPGVGSCSQTGPVFLAEAPAWGTHSPLLTSRSWGLGALPAPRRRLGCRGIEDRLTGGIARLQGAPGGC